MVKFKGTGHSQVQQLFVDLSKANGECKDKITKEIFYKTSFLTHNMVSQLKWADNRDDLLSTANEALVRAIRTYDYKKCNNFYLWAFRKVAKAFSKEKHKYLQWQSQYGVVWQSPKTPEQITLLVEEENVFDLAFNTLDSKGQTVVSRSFGLDGKRPQNLKVIADGLGMGRNKALRIKNGAVDKITKLCKSYTLAHANIGT